MKRILIILVALSVIFTMGACAAKDPKTDEESKIFDGSLESILEKIYDTADTTEAFKEYIKEGVETVKITDENMEYQLGKKGIEFKEAIASEPMIQPSAYSLCLVRVKEGADVEKIKTEIKDNVNPAKWICVGVDPKNVIVDSIGDVIFLVMSNEAAKPLHEAFLTLKD